jgi:pullulanase/glycogen debranching enzyme
MAYRLATQVRDMLYDSCAMWLSTYRCDGLRFDSANDLPRDVIQVRPHAAGRSAHVLLHGRSCAHEHVWPSSCCGCRAERLAEADVAYDV